ncbi:MAG TPA: glycosyltransferase family 2 protein, partial [Thermodesulfobacteriota bacterium]|nr:glycosyltransferase family 2 protein [Thermodesulfobacteriota bacterium]
MLNAAESTEAGIVYSDFYESGKILHPLNDYQPGSVRDDFDFGSMILFSTQAVRNALEKYGSTPAVQFAGLYDLRLKVSIEDSLIHLRQPLYTMMEEGEPAGDEKQFAYVDPKNEGVQKEMEAVFTEHLKRIGAYLPQDSFRRIPPDPAPFPVEASVVIPVRNREKTIADAVKSALSQETSFPFNALVVDNHSTDRTTAVLADLAGRYPALKHIIPGRTDLGIGGCWNEALGHQACGRYAVQLDSDDLYSSSRTLQKMVDTLRGGDYALVIGSYTLVDSSLKEIPPGLI